MTDRFDTSPSAMAPYRETYRLRRQRDELERKARAERAWPVARQCAEVLRDHFGAEWVAVYGSLARGTFGLRSDIDLTARGIAPASRFEAGASVLEIGGEFDVNFVAYEACSGELAAEIDRDAVELP